MLIPGAPEGMGSPKATRQVPNIATAAQFYFPLSELIRLEHLECAWIFSEKRTTETQATVISNAHM